ncbi:unnamed protein product [Allacma fusca]|uniref:Uncharacterized protein n=1 Tax=Allacma fusca TaxID=39272 RepID=A0A8J2PM91_9HEXA|nr:unnamed protein product [Allacma fusca]
MGDIFKAFPKLTELSLDGRCDFKYFSGISNAGNATYERPDEYIPRQKSITDFLELETIIFGWSFVVDPDMVRYCLRRVPKLKEVSLHWNESLSAPLLHDSIGHLERITILNTAHGGFQDAMAQVAEMLPNACLK